MAEYIEKQAARPDEFCVGVSCQECPFLKDPLYGGCRVDDFIMALPSADVRPVVRGEWLHEDSASNYLAFKCSVCGTGGRLHKFSFCSHCGADMRGGDADGDEKD